MPPRKIVWRRCSFIYPVGNVSLLRDSMILPHGKMVIRRCIVINPLGNFSLPLGRMILLRGKIAVDKGEVKIKKGYGKFVKRNKVNGII